MLKDNVDDERKIAPKTSAKYQYLAAIVGNYIEEIMDCLES